MRKKENQRTKPVFAKKSFGQNFLIDQNYINKIVSALDLQPDETVIEIGPGRGALTQGLIESGAKVIAIELERDMIAFLREKFGEYDNFQLIEHDALKVDFKEISKIYNKSSRFKVVANLPYYISTAILQKIIEQREVFSEMILMFQREVVDRITAGVGNKERGFLTVLAEGYLKTEKLFDVPPTAFRPAPKVFSSVMRLITKEENEILSDDRLFRAFISAAFAQKRKTILNNFKNAPTDLKEKIGEAERFLESGGIDSNRRAETLTLAEWENLIKFLS